MLELLLRPKTSNSSATLRYSLVNHSQASYRKAASTSISAIPSARRSIDQQCIYFRDLHDVSLCIEPVNVYRCSQVAALRAAPLDSPALVWESHAQLFSESHVFLIAPVRRAMA
jgi:hypothetical protein